jgi:hypothetical protein
VQLSLPIEERPARKNGEVWLFGLFCAALKKIGRNILTAANSTVKMDLLTGDRNLWGCQTI